MLMSASPSSFRNDSFDTYNQGKINRINPRVKLDIEQKDKLRIGKGTFSQKHFPGRKFTYFLPNDQQQLNKISFKLLRKHNYREEN
jgi:hypothetical protein